MSAAGAQSKSDEKKADDNDDEKLKLPRFKHTFFSSSVLSHHTEKEDSDACELYGQHQRSLPPKRQEYAMLDEESAVPRSDDDGTTRRELGRMMAPVRFATMRDGLERGTGSGGGAF